MKFHISDNERLFLLTYIYITRNLMIVVLIIMMPGNLWMWIEVSGKSFPRPRFESECLLNQWTLAVMILIFPLKNRTPIHFTRIVSCKPLPSMSLFGGSEIQFEPSHFVFCVPSFTRTPRCHGYASSRLGKLQSSG